MQKELENPSGDTVVIKDRFQKKTQYKLEVTSNHSDFPDFEKWFTLENDMDDFFLRPASSASLLSDFLNDREIIKQA